MLRVRVRAHSGVHGERFPGIFQHKAPLVGVCMPSFGFVPVRGEASPNESPNGACWPGSPLPADSRTAWAPAWWRAASPPVPIQDQVRQVPLSPRVVGFSNETHPGALRQRVGHRHQCQRQISPRGASPIGIISEVWSSRPAVRRTRAMPQALPAPRRRLLVAYRERRTEDQPALLQLAQNKAGLRGIRHLGG